MKRRASIVLMSALLASTLTATAGGNYGPGVDDKSILIGQTMVYSGPASAFGIAGKILLAYLAELNAKGGINGRKVELLSVDDACTPAKTVEATRKLVEVDKVLGLFGSTCTGPQVAVQKYLNDNKVPQFLTTASGSTMYDHVAFPWSVPFAFSYELEGENYGRFIREHKPGAKIGIITQNDDVGKSLLRGFTRGLGDGGTIVKQVTYETTDPTIDSQVIEIRDSGADTFANFAVLKYAAMSLREVRTLGWKPFQVIMTSSSSIPGVLEKAGPLKDFTDVMTGAWYKTPSDPRWASDPGNMNYLAFMKRNFPNLEADDAAAVHGYLIAEMTAKVLERAGDDLTRENLLKVVNSISNEELSMLLPGITVNISADNHFAIRAAKMAKFDGSRWVLLD
jgi:branched-chain amino acid transport system substrate-binding protein